jgi:hypothetical protein
MQDLTRILSLAPLASAPNRQLIAAAPGAASLAGLDPALLASLFLAASDLIGNYCHRRSVDGAPPTFARQSIRESVVIPADYRSFRPTRLQFGLRPLTLTAISIDAEPIDITDLYVDVFGGLSWKPQRDRAFWQAGVEIVADYTAGYVTPVQAALPSPPTGPALPADLIRAIEATAQNLQSQQQRTQFDVASVEETDSDAGSLTTRYFQAGRAGALSAEAMGLLAPYCESF